MRYLVKDRAGRELTATSLRHLVALYERGLVDDDDEVRAERSPRWERAGSLPALTGPRLRSTDPRRVAAVLFAVVALVAALALLLAGR